MTILLILVCCATLIDLIACVKLSNCPKDNVHFEKIIGVRPSEETKRFLLYQDKEGFPVTTECVSKCSSDKNCLSFVLFYNTSSCFWFRSDFEGIEEKEGEQDSNSAWFVKRCLTSTDRCDKLWFSERIPGATLIGNDTLALPELVTEEECSERCLNETEFDCRSAKFRLKTADYGPNAEVAGICTLSDTDRHLMPNGYRVSGFDDEYLENQCASTERNFKNEYCTYEEYVNVTLSHKDIFYGNKTKAECENLCETYKSFNCRGYSITPLEAPNRFECFLHSEDSKVLGPRLLQRTENGYYYEKATCLNISVSCTSSFMTVTYNPLTNFNGKIYMQGYSENPECFARGSKQNTVMLRLPLLNGQCGITKADSDDKRTLLSGNMVLQYNAFIQTQADRLIRVGCIFGNDTRLVVGTGLTISTSYPNQGSTLVNSSSSLPIPRVDMKVLDLLTQQEVSDSQIGQELELVIELKDSDLPYDIWASHLVAMSENSEDSILLLDERGCPTNLNIFPPISKIYTNSTKKLLAVFQAFKFSSSSVVRFSVIVQFCPNRCPPANCGNGIESYGRRKREIQLKSIDTVNGTRIIEVNRTEFENSRPNMEQMPLEVAMVVHDPKLLPDSLIYGEGRKVLVAGYDTATDQVCLDYSLFVGLLVTWVLIQVIFVVACLLIVRRYRKYYEDTNMRQSLEELHKNFGIGFSNLENRRVHWADSGNFT